MILFYLASIESLLTFSLVSWFGNLSVKYKNSLSQIVRWSSKLIGESQRMTNSILNDDSSFEQ